MAHRCRAGSSFSPPHRLLYVGVGLSATDRCASWRPVQLLTRRAGATRPPPRAAANGCTFLGDIEVDYPGRWFVYAEVDIAGERTETWIPVDLARVTRAYRQAATPVTG